MLAIEEELLLANYNETKLVFIDVTNMESLLFLSQVLFVIIRWFWRWAASWAPVNNRNQIKKIFMILMNRIGFGP